MIIKNYTAVGFRCSHCGNVEKKRINLFDYSGKEGIIRCSSCNRPVALIEKSGRTKYKLEVTCFECGERHKYEVPINEFWHTGLKELACPQIEETVFAIGDDENISELIQEEFFDIDFDGEERFDEVHLDGEALFESISKGHNGFSDASEFLECLEHFKRLSADNKIGCVCGERLIQLQIEEDGFRVLCPSCGRDLFLGFSAPEQIEYIKKLSEIYLTD